VEAREADLALIRAALDQTQAEARKAHAEAETLRQARGGAEGQGPAGAAQGCVAGGIANAGR
jgi:hypothetical protein